MMKQTDALSTLATVILQNMRVQMTQALEIARICGEMGTIIARVKEEEGGADSLITLVRTQANLQGIAQEIMQNAMTTLFANDTSRAEIEWR